MPERLFAPSSDEDDIVAPGPSAASRGRSHGPHQTVRATGASQPNGVSRGPMDGVVQPSNSSAETRARSRSRRVKMRGEERADWRSDTAAPSASRDSGPCHWAACINADCAEWRARLGRQLRKILVVTAYTGTNASGEVLREIGISHQDLVASDPKAAARRFREHNGLAAACGFDCIRELNQDGIGWCWRCLSAHCRLPSITPDLAVLGFPCRPFSRARTGSSSVDDVENTTNSTLQPMPCDSLPGCAPWPLCAKTSWDSSRGSKVSVCVWRPRDTTSNRASCLSIPGRMLQVPGSTSLRWTSRGHRAQH